MYTRWARCQGGSEEGHGAKVVGHRGADRVHGACGAKAALSKAQQEAIGTITAKLSAAERKDIDSWPDKKLVELLCKPTAIAELKKQYAKTDRVFFGPDDEGVKKFKVEGNRRVSGDGTVRVGPEWKDLTFDCVLDPEKAVVVSFSYKMK